MDTSREQVRCPFSAKAIGEVNSKVKIMSITSMLPFLRFIRFIVAAGRFSAILWFSSSPTSLPDRGVVLVSYPPVTEYGRLTINSQKRLTSGVVIEYIS